MRKNPFARFGSTFGRDLATRTGHGTEVGSATEHDKKNTLIPFSWKNPVRPNLARGTILRTLLFSLFATEAFPTKIIFKNRSDPGYLRTFSTN